MISTPERMEKPVRRPMVPPISPSWASRVTWRKEKGICKNSNSGTMVELQVFYLNILFNVVVGGRVEMDLKELQLGCLDG